MMRVSVSSQPRRASMTPLDQAIDEQPEIGYDSATDRAIAWVIAVKQWEGVSYE